MTPQEDFGLRQAPDRLTPAGRRWLSVLEDNPGYCTDDTGDRVALARVLAASPPPLALDEWELLIARSIKGFIEGMEAGAGAGSISIALERNTRWRSISAATSGLPCSNRESCRYEHERNDTHHV